MVRWLFVGLAVLALSQASVAWGDYASQYFCEQAAENVWGSRIYEECAGSWDMQDQISYCRLRADKRNECMDLNSTIHPALLGNALGESNLPHDGPCPINMYPDELYLCANSTQALDESIYWLEKATLADSVCRRIYLFCAASNYLAQTYHPLNWVLHEDANCRAVFNRKTDFDLRENQSSWGINQVCVFDYDRPAAGGSIPSRYSQSISITEDTVEKIVKNLTAEARIIEGLPLGQESTTTTTLSPKMYCVEDEDCVAVKGGCCGCNAGGNQSTISKWHEKNYLSDLASRCATTACPEVMSQHISCYSKPVCQDNACVLEPDTEKLCQAADVMVNCAGAEPTPEPGYDEWHGVSCGYINYLCRAEPTTTTSSTVTSSSTSSTQESTTSSTQSINPTSTTLAREKQEAMSFLPFMLVALVLAAAAAYYLYNHPPKEEPVKKRNPFERGASKLGSVEAIPQVDAKTGEPVEEETPRRRSLSDKRPEEGEKSPAFKSEKGGTSLGDAGSRD